MPTLPGGLPASAQPRSWKTSAQRVLVVLVVAAAIPAVFSLATEHGFYEPPAEFLTPTLLHGFQFAAVFLFVVERLFRLATSPDRIRVLRAHPFDYAVVVLGGVTLAVGVEIGRQAMLKYGTAYIILMQVLILARIGIQLVRINMELAERHVNPTRLLAGGFGVTILVGAVLLSLPKAAKPILWGDSAYYALQHVLNCLFTATSATCVTGLVVYDTGSDFTMFGQVVILLLIQLGGLGIMIFSGVLGLLLGGQISLRGTLVLQDAVSKGTIGQIGSLIRFICLTTVLVEAVGTLLLYPMWDPEITEPGRRWFLSLFHSVSAFCNAGFSLQENSLIPYRGAWQVYGTIMPLIIIGGLGFPAIRNIFVVTRNRITYRIACRKHLRKEIPRPPRPLKMSLSLHSKIVLGSSAILIVLGALLLFACETSLPYATRYAPPAEGASTYVPGPETMVGMRAWERCAAALFQSVTARTAGFNSVRTDYQSLSPAAHFVLCVWMFIGGSPASTAGGVKTVAIAILLLSVMASLRRREHPEVFSRTIGEEAVKRAAVLVFGMFCVVTLVTFALTITETASLREVLFEAVSACGTVGLSTGLTPQLTGFGKVVIMLAMFAGRLGPLTLLIAVAGKTRTARYEYPTESVVIG